MYPIDKYALFILIFSVLLYSAIYYFCFKDNYNIIILVEKISFIIHLITFGITFLINPGIPKREYYTKRFEKEYKGDFKKLNYCEKCNITIPKHFHVAHCNFCDICVKNYDHHCPWIGKCVGKYTKIPFYLFIFWILFYIISSLVTFIAFLRNYFNYN